jgi:phosphomannomutase
MKAAGGIQISASHNPPQYNGMKLFSGEGRVIPAVRGQRVLDRYVQLDQESRISGRASGDETAEGVNVLDDTTSQHLELIEGICNVARIREQRFRVVLDANHGAGSLLGAGLLEHLGCDLTVLGATPDGNFAHPPEPTEANLQTVLREVTGRSAAIGFCQDPDADRLAIIDERGRYIGEEKTLALCVDHVLRSGRREPVVTNCSTSRMSEDLARMYGVPFYRSKVGEANVVDLMIDRGAVIGGEGNGGVIDPRVGLVRDSFVGMALVLEAMATRGLPVSALADELPRYSIYKSTISVPQEKVGAALDAIERSLSGGTSDRMDGLRLDWPSGKWLLVRPSNTEPIVRAIAEAATFEAAESLCTLAERAVVDVR